MPTRKEMRWVLFNFLSEVVLPLATMYWQLQTLLCFGRCFLSTTPSIIIWEGVGGRCQTVAIRIWVPWAKKHRSHLAAMALETADHRSYPVNDGSRQGIVRESSPNGNNSGLCLFFFLVPLALGHIGGHSHLVDTSQGPPHVRELRRAEVPEAHGLERQKNQLPKRCHSCLEYFVSVFPSWNAEWKFQITWFTCLIYM